MTPPTPSGSPKSGHLPGPDPANMRSLLPSPPASGVYDRFRYAREALVAIREKAQESGYVAACMADQALRELQTQWDEVTDA